MKIKKTGKTWSILNEVGHVVEGGFFDKYYAEQALQEWLKFRNK